MLGREGGREGGRERFFPPPLTSQDRITEDEGIFEASVESKVYVKILVLQRSQRSRQARFADGWGGREGGSGEGVEKTKKQMIIIIVFLVFVCFFSGPPSSC